MFPESTLSDIYSKYVSLHYRTTELTAPRQYTLSTTLISAWSCDDRIVGGWNYPSLSDSHLLPLLLLRNEPCWIAKLSAKKKKWRGTYQWTVSSSSGIVSNKETHRTTEDITPQVCYSAVINWQAAMIRTSIDLRQAQIDLEAGTRKAAVWL